MAFKTDWLNPPYILGTEFSGMVTAGDLNIAMLEYLGAVQVQPLYILMDFAGTRALPNKLFELPACTQVINHANTRWFAVVSPRGFNSHTTRLLARDKVKLFTDTTSALAFLRGMVRMDVGVVLKDKTP